MSVFSSIPWKSASGGPGPDLSGITAGGPQILAGYQSVDRAGDPVYGELYPVNTDGPVFTAAESLAGPEVIVLSVPSTGYYLSDNSGGFGLWASWASVAAAVGLTADKLKPGVTVMGVTGR